MISLQDEISIVQEILKELHAIIDAIAFFLSGGPIQLWSNEGLAEEANDADM